MQLGSLNALISNPNGDKTPVVLIHGALHGAWCWQGNFLEQFANAGHPTYAIDLPGHGRSETSKSLRFLRIKDYTKAAMSAIDALDAPPFVFGHSMGGFVVQHMLATPNAPKIAGAGLLASTPAHGMYRFALGMIAKQPLTFAKVNLTMSLKPVFDDPDGAAEMFLGSDGSPAARQTLAANLQDESFMAFLDMLMASLPAKPVHSVPSLVMAGEHDPICSAAEEEKLAKRLGAEFSVLAGAPHNLMMGQNTNEAGQILLDWMARNSA